MDGDNVSISAMAIFGASLLSPRVKVNLRDLMT